MMMMQNKLECLSFNNFLDVTYLQLLSVAKKIFYYFDNWCQDYTTSFFVDDDDTK